MRFTTRWQVTFDSFRVRWHDRLSRASALLQRHPSAVEPPSPVALLLREVPIPQPFDIAAYCASIAVRRDRPIRLYPAIMNGKPFGLWVPLATEDQIWYESETSAWHQQHIILHEIGHMLYNHGLGDHAYSGDYPYELLPDLSPERFIGMRRDGFATREELEAEVFAKEVRRRIGQRSATAPRGANPRAAGFLARLSNLYDGGDDGWSAR